jgi:NitT/TauT family transport system ATP-binding protein
MPKAPDISIRGLTVRFKTAESSVLAVDNVDIDIPSGSFLTIVGPSGCGKTTLLKVLSGVLVPTSGVVSFDGLAVDKSKVTGRVGYVFQRPLLLSWKTALENVMLTLEIARKDLSRAERLRDARHWINVVGLTTFEDRYPHELSGGMQQRVSIARALAFRPQVLLMDEPFAALDEITREKLQEELLELWQKLDTTVLFITHSIPEALILSQRIIVMSARPGRVVEQIDVDFPRPRSEATRELPIFNQMAGHIRHLLREKEDSTPAAHRVAA